MTREEQAADYGSRYLRARSKEGLSNRQVQIRMKRLGIKKPVSHRQLQKIEKGESYPWPSTRNKIALSFPESDLKQ